MAKLVIKHIPASEPATFEVVRHPDGKHGPPCIVSSPHKWPVTDQPQSNLMERLRWYLEEFLDYPFSPRASSRPRM